MRRLLLLILALAGLAAAQVYPIGTFNHLWIRCFMGDTCLNPWTKGDTWAAPPWCKVKAYVDTVSGGGSTYNDSANARNGRRADSLHNYWADTLTAKWFVGPVFHYSDTNDAWCPVDSPAPADPWPSRELFANGLHIWSKSGGHHQNFLDFPGVGGGLFSVYDSTTTGRFHVYKEGFEFLDTLHQTTGDSLDNPGNRLFGGRAWNDLDIFGHEFYGIVAQHNSASGINEFQAGADSVQNAAFAVTVGNAQHDTAEQWSDFGFYTNKRFNKGDTANHDSDLVTKGYADAHGGGGSGTVKEVRAGTWVTMTESPLTDTGHVGVYTSHTWPHAVDQLARDSALYAKALALRDSLQNLRDSVRLDGKGAPYDSALVSATAHGLSAAYIDWTGSGGASILNKPSIPAPYDSSTGAQRVSGLTATQIEAAAKDSFKRGLGTVGRGTWAYAGESLAVDTAAMPHGGGSGTTTNITLAPGWPRDTTLGFTLTLSGGGFTGGGIALWRSLDSLNVVGMTITFDTITPSASLFGTLNFGVGTDSNPDWNLRGNEVNWMDGMGGSGIGVNISGTGNFPYSTYPMDMNGTNLNGFIAWYTATSSTHAFLNWGGPMFAGTIRVHARIRIWSLNATSSTTVSATNAQWTGTDSALRQVGDTGRFVKIFRAGHGAGTGGGLDTLPTVLDSTDYQRADGKAGKRVGIFYETEFGYGSFPIWNAGAVASGTAITTLAGTPQHPAITYYNSSTSANSGYYAATRAAAILLAGSEQTDLVARFDTMTNSTTYFGFHNSVNSTRPTMGCFFLVSGTTARGFNFATTGDSTASTYTLTKLRWYWFNVRIKSDAAWSYFTIKDSVGTLVFSDSLNTKMPTTAGQETGHGVVSTNSGTTAYPLIDLDYMNFCIKRKISAGRPN